MTLIVEPGRAIVGPAGVLLASVVDVKPRADGTWFVVLDAGMSELMRPALYGAYHRIALVEEREDDVVTCDVVGPICESSDVFGVERRLPLPAVGELVAVLTPAYGSAWRPLPSAPVAGQGMVDARLRCAPTQTIDAAAGCSARAPEPSVERRGILRVVGPERSAATIAGWDRRNTRTLNLVGRRRDSWGLVGAGRSRRTTIWRLGDVPMLIALEGLDQAGKETQGQLLRDGLRADGRRARLESFPDYGTSIGEEIARALQGERDYGPDVMQLLYVANRYERKADLQRWLEAGIIVICDRYVASSVAYGEAQDLDVEWLDGMQRFLPPPDVTFLLDIPPELAATRKSTGLDRYERDLALLTRVRASYLRQAEHDGWIRVDGSRARAEVADEIMSALDGRLAPADRRLAGSVASTRAQARRRPGGDVVDEQHAGPSTARRPLEARRGEAPSR